MNYAVHAPMPIRLAYRGMVTSVDQVASTAGIEILAEGGSAVDAAIATNAVLAVTTQHQCGIGGDLIAIVAGHGGDPVAMIAAGRAGSGADPERLRREGATAMPLRGDIRSVTIPGCVDGWFALHQRFGRLPMARLLARGIEHARNGFAASPLLAQRASTIEHLDGAAPYRGLSLGSRVVREGVARTLEAIAADGRAGFYQGEFGQGLVALGGGEYAEADLVDSFAEFCDAISVDVWGHRLWAAPPPSQGYLTLAAAKIVEHIGLPDDPDDPEWAHRVIEAAKYAGFDREAVLSESADGSELLADERLIVRADAINAEASTLMVPSAAGGTIHLNVIDEDGLAVSFTQSNCAGFGAFIVEPNTGVFLHNRGLGFNLVAGHPAEYQPGRRPPHTLSPAAITTRDGRVRAVLGTMGADSQPQVLLQLATRLLRHHQTPEDAIAAGRFSLAGETEEAFAVWRGTVAVPRVKLEGQAPHAWVEGLRERGHTVEVEEPFSYYGGHAHVIEATAAPVASDAQSTASQPLLRGAADPRVRNSDAIGR